MTTGCGALARRCADVCAGEQLRKLHLARLRQTRARVTIWWTATLCGFTRVETAPTARPLDDVEAAEDDHANVGRGALVFVNEQR